MEHSRCFTNTDFLPPSMNVAFTNEVWWIKNSLFFADRLYMIALFWTSICSKELSEVTSSHELITLTILSHHSFLCIYLRAYEDHFHITISTMSADKSATCLQLLFCLNEDGLEISFREEAMVMRLHSCGILKFLINFIFIVPAFIFKTTLKIRYIRHF